MSDLISRSDLIAKIENDIKDTENYMVLFSSNRVALSSQLNTLKTYKAIIENQQTAFDKEKVVAELEDSSRPEIADDMDAFGDIPSIVVSLNTAIDIVRKGGIE